MESGYYTSLEGFQRVPVQKRMITNTAIERASGTAAHGMLFSHEVIEESDVHEDVLFRGIVTLPEALRSKLIELAGYRQRIAVGYGRSRGLGQLSVAGWGTPAVERQTLADRWATFNEVACALWDLFQRQPQGEYFSLTLQSHLALRDAAGEPILGRIRAEDLGLPGAAVRCRSVLSAVAVPGWNAALNLPKPDTWALGRGSALLFRLPPGHDRRPVIDRLQEIEREGVGDRRAEGFGRMTACDRFHFYFLQRKLLKG
jgi:CRISPR-associated protein Csx10